MAYIICEPCVDVKDKACVEICPVDCIYEVPSPIPGQSYHQIDTTRCIGCQMCYRSPNDSSEHYTLTICPWNAIDMLHNPNVKPDDVSVLAPYWRGSEADLPWPKLEEYGYQLFLEGQVFLPTSRQDLSDAIDEIEDGLSDALPASVELLDAPVRDAGHELPECAGVNFG